MADGPAPTMGGGAKGCSRDCRGVQSARDRVIERDEAPGISEGFAIAPPIRCRMVGKFAPEAGVEPAKHSWVYLRLLGAYGTQQHSVSVAQCTPFLGLACVWRRPACEGRIVFR